MLELPLPALMGRAFASDGASDTRLARMLESSSSESLQPRTHLGAVQSPPHLPDFVTHNSEAARPSPVVPAIRYRPLHPLKRVPGS